MKLKLDKLFNDGRCESCNTRQNVKLVALVVNNQHGQQGTMTVYLCEECAGRQGVGG